MLNKNCYNRVATPGKSRAATVALALNSSRITDQVSVRTGALTLALMALFLPGCTTDERVGGPTAETNVTTEEVAEETAQLIGQPVTIRSQPVRKISPYAFTMSDQELFGSESILVVNASGEPTILPENVELQVTGEVARFVTVDIEREYGWDLEPNLYAEYEGKPAIIAQSIALAPEPDTITDNPTPFYNKVIAVSSEVQEVSGARTFELEDDLLVLNPLPVRIPEEGQDVVVTGVLRPFVLAEIDRDYDLGWDLETQRELEVEYSNKPVLVAQRVYPRADE